MVLIPADRALLRGEGGGLLSLWYAIVDDVRRRVAQLVHA